MSRLTFCSAFSESPRWSVAKPKYKIKQPVISTHYYHSAVIVNQLWLQPCLVNQLSCPPEVLFDEPSNEAQREVLSLLIVAWTATAGRRPET